MTLKTHIIIHHYQFYFEKMGTNFSNTNGEFGETLHSTLEKHEQNHGYSVKRKKGTPHHLGSAHKSISHINAEKMGSPATKKMRLGHRSNRQSPVAVG